MSNLDKILEDGDAGTNETAAAVLAGLDAADIKPHALDDEGRFSAILVGSDLRLVDTKALEADYDAKYGEIDQPRRKTGTVHVQDARSFINYLARHQVWGTEVFADAARQKLVGVINGHCESDDQMVFGDAGHGDHRVALELLPTPEWKAWIENDKKPLNQVAFAEHIEDNAADVVHPDAATMIEVASHLVATTSADFKQAVRLDNGQVQFRYEETVNASAGAAGDLEIPTEFTIAVAPFVGSDPVEIRARFRFRINGGKLILSYALLRPEQIARQAFLDHAEHVADSVDAPVFQGRPE